MYRGIVTEGLEVLVVYSNGQEEEREGLKRHL